MLLRLFKKDDPLVDVQPAIQRLLKQPKSPLTELQMLHGLAFEAYRFWTKPQDKWKARDLAYYTAEYRVFRLKHQCPFDPHFDTHPAQPYPPLAAEEERDEEQMLRRVASAFIGCADRYANRLDREALERLDQALKDYARFRIVVRLVYPQEPHGMFDGYVRNILGEDEVRRVEATVRAAVAQADELDGDAPDDSPSP